MGAINNLLDTIKSPDLRHVSETGNGWTRRRHGRGFAYYDQDGQKITDAQQLKRINALGIPPAWKHVWICPHSDGHLQATGRDEKGRKQYIYHQDWTAFRQAGKFRKMLAFAERLPAIRATVDQHLRKRSWTREKVCALAVKILDEYGLRIGNARYKDTNGTYGLTTLRRKHIDESEGRLQLSYKAKSGIYQQITVDNKRLARLVRACSELPGYEIFRYEDEDGKTYPLDSSDVNEYIKQIAGEEFSSKDFRTWTATVLAVDRLPEAQALLAEKPRRKLEVTLVKLVSQALGNTMTVCRKYYIHPAVLVAVQEEEFRAEDLCTPEALAAFENQLEESEVVAYRLIESALNAQTRS